MEFRAAVICLAGVMFSPALALADPVTYIGKLDKADIVVEFTDDPAGAAASLAGRYHDRSQGFDIPLQPKSRNGGAIELSEEAPCGDACEDGEPGPIGATWSLGVEDGGRKLEGTRKDGATNVNITLERAGARSVDGEKPELPLDLYNFSGSLIGRSKPITMETSPYDYLRLDVPLKEGAIEGWADASYRYVVDPRTTFRTPRVATIAEGSTDTVNTTLRDRHWRQNLIAFDCAAKRFAGFQQYGPDPGGSDGTFGGQDEVETVVTALTPKLMSWRETGYLECGGVHPENISDSLTVEVRTGRDITLKDMFTDVSEDNWPGEELVAFVREARNKSGEAGGDVPGSCDTDAQIEEFLVASLKREDDGLRMVFSLERLPYAAQECAVDHLVEVPVADVIPLLKPAFAALLAK